mgnify:CR=1 FL=1
MCFGGNENELKDKRSINSLINLRYMGYISHTRAMQIMKTVDVLLMPYQKSVSIGAEGHDTAGWMSPMKMFEYMATGLPIISSDLPVLKEILKDGENSILVPPDDINCWVKALDKVLNNASLAEKIGACAHQEYKENYTWTKRAARLIEIIE